MPGQSLPFRNRCAERQGHESVGPEKGLQHKHMNHDVALRQDGRAPAKKCETDRNDGDHSQGNGGAAYAMPESHGHQNRWHQKKKRIARLRKHADRDHNDEHQLNQ